MSLCVIGVGLPRTGTLSLKLALNELGFGPCFHGTELAARPERIGLWVQAGAGEADWDAIFQDYRACVDAPGCYFWRELIQRYPDAKVIHTVRDPDGWFDSASATIWAPSAMAADPPPGLAPFFEMMTRLQGAEVSDRRAMIERFQRHTEAVRQAVPPDRLLEFEIGQGWAPLCRFLGVPVPDKPFPRTNERTVFAGQYERPPLDAPWLRFEPVSQLDELTQRLGKTLGLEVDLGMTVKFDLRGGGFVYVRPGEVSNEDRPADLTLTISIDDLNALGDGRLDPMAALSSGALAFSDGALALALLGKMTSHFGR